MGEDPLQREGQHENRVTITDNQAGVNLRSSRKLPFSTQEQLAKSRVRLIQDHRAQTETELFLALLVVVTEAKLL